MTLVKASLTTPLVRGLLASTIVISALAFGARAPSADDGPPPPAGVLFLENAPGDAEVSILFLPEQLPDLPPPETTPSRLVVTGAYSSGDRFAPEGFVIRAGDATHPWPQGWDGLLLTTPEGEASIHEVSHVKLEGEAYNLRDKGSRKTFLTRAEELKLSSVQSHLLIRNGALDLRPTENAPIFRRRMLFQTPDGRIGVYDTTPRAVTLYEAAAELLDTIEPEMALNLDMGAYDFCERAASERFANCGLIGRDDLSKLTNLIVFTKR